MSNTKVAIIGFTIIAVLLFWTIYIPFICMDKIQELIEREDNKVRSKTTFNKVGKELNAEAARKLCANKNMDKKLYNDVILSIGFSANRGVDIAIIDLKGYNFTEISACTKKLIKMGYAVDNLGNCLQVIW